MRVAFVVVVVVVIRSIGEIRPRKTEEEEKKVTSIASSANTMFTYQIEIDPVRYWGNDLEKSRSAERQWHSTFSFNKIFFAFSSLKLHPKETMQTE